MLFLSFLWRDFDVGYQEGIPKTSNKSRFCCVCISLSHLARSPPLCSVSRFPGLLGQCGQRLLHSWLICLPTVLVEGRAHRCCGLFAHV